MRLSGVTINVVGSSAASVDRALLRNTHAFVAALVAEALRSGANIAILVSQEPRIDQADPLSAQVFAWTILEAASAYFQSNTKDDGRGRVRVIVSNSAKARRPSHRVDLWNDLARAGTISPFYVEEESYLGVLVRKKEVELSDAMIAIGGGKGVLDSANGHMDSFHPVLPINVAIGGFAQDAEGSTALFRRLLVDPEPFVGRISDEERADLARLELGPMTEPDAFASLVLGVLERSIRRRRASMANASKQKREWFSGPPVSVLVLFCVLVAVGVWAVINTQASERRRNEREDQFCRTCEDSRKDPKQCVCSPKDRAYRDKLCTAGMILSRTISECVGSKGQAATATPTSAMTLDMTSCYERVVSSDPANRDLLKETPFDQDEQVKWLARCYPSDKP